MRRPSTRGEEGYFFIGFLAVFGVLVDLEHAAPVENADGNFTIVGGCGLQHASSREIDLRPDGTVISKSDDSLRDEQAETTLSRLDNGSIRPWASRYHLLPVSR